jgi:putative CocE/NonD family hydrolase
VTWFQDLIVPAPKLEVASWPSVFIAGWWDVFQQQTLDAFKGYASKAGNALMIVTPTGHCAWPFDQGDPLPSPAAVTLASVKAAEAIYLAILSKVTPGGGVVQLSKSLPRVAFYLMGPTANFWAVSQTGLPASTPQRWFLGSDGSMALTAGAAGSRTLVSNPCSPIATVGGSNLLDTCGPLPQNLPSGPECMANTVTALCKERDGLLFFDSAPMSADTLLIGAIKAHLTVSSTANDTDFAVHLSVVTREGVSFLVQDGIVRMRWRNGMDGTPEWITPSQPYEVDVDLTSTALLVPAGFKLRVTVAASNFKRFGLNLNNGRLITEGGPPVTATNTVLLGSASYIDLPLVQDQSSFERIDSLDRFVEQVAQSLEADGLKREL